MTKAVNIVRRTEQEIATMKKMIALYCKGNHQDHRTKYLAESGLCSECDELLAYALERIDRCPIKQEKDFCSECKIHCYKPTMREHIRTVMRYSGPRMLWHDPVMALRHLSTKKRSKRTAHDADPDKNARS